MSTKPVCLGSMEDWRPALLESLRNCGVQREKVSWWRRVFLLLALIFIAGFPALIVGAVELFTQDPNLVQILTWVYRVAMVLLTLVWLDRARRQLLQMRAQSALAVLESPKAKRPVFYLRSFALDASIAKPTLLQKLFSLPNDEQKVTAQLRKLGPVIAIGRPGEKLPALGAARFYASDDLWHAKVADVVNASQLVFWASGVTEGLRWEISHLIGTLPPEKLVLWAHPQLLHLGAAEREAEWKKFIGALGGVFPKPLPESLGDARFFCFAADWTPIPIAPSWRGPVRALRSFFSPLGSAMRTVRRIKQGKIAPQQVAYHHAERDLRESDFARLIGVGDKSIRWPNVIVFAIAKAAVLPVSLCLFALVICVTDQPELASNFSFMPWRLVPGALLFATMQAACTVIAFRKIRSWKRAAIATATAFTLLLPLGVMSDPRALSELRYSDQYLFGPGGTQLIFNVLVLGTQSLVCVSAGLLVLAYAVKRYMPLAKALLLGELGGSVLAWSAFLFIPRLCSSLVFSISRPVSPADLIYRLLGFLLLPIVAPLGGVYDTLVRASQHDLGPRVNEILGLDRDFVGLMISSLVFPVALWVGTRIVGTLDHRIPESAGVEARV